MKAIVLGLVILFVASPSFGGVDVYAFPNPARHGRVTFSHELVDCKKPTQITVKVFTITGDLVWSQADLKEMENISWDCRNEAGEKVASGVYLYRIITEINEKKKVVTKKLIVIQDN